MNLQKKISGTHLERWLPAKPDILTATTSNVWNMLVSDLINHSLRIWDANVIDVHFLEHMKSQICAIQVSLHNVKHIMTWNLTADGAYSVKTGYHLVLSRNNSGSTSTSAVTGDIW